MKATLATLILYVYNTYLYEDWSVYTKFGKIVIYPFWLIRWVYIAVASPILALGYYVERSDLYDMFMEARLQSMVMMEEMTNQFNQQK